jgi:hypothetical protein
MNNQVVEAPSETRHPLNEPSNESWAFTHDIIEVSRQYPIIRTVLISWPWERQTGIQMGR